MIVDTSVLLAFLNSAEPRHDEVVAAISARSSDRMVVSPYVVAELDHIIATRVGVHAELMMLRELAGGAWELPHVSQSDIEAAATVIEKYPDQQVGVADASLVVLAHRYGTRTIATLDRRHFSVLRPLAGGRFTLVP